MPSVFSRSLPLVVLATSLVAAACQMQPERNQFADLTFQHMTPIRLDVRDIVVEQAYSAPLESPNVDHDFPVKPMDAAVRWAEDRLVAAGATRTATFVVRDASVVETPLPQAGGLEGMLTTEQSERYEARLEIQIVIRDDRGWEEGSLVTEVNRTVTVPEDSTLNEREKAWYAMTEKLLADLDRQLAQTIETTFHHYLVL